MVTQTAQTAPTNSIVVRMSNVKYLQVVIIYIFCIVYNIFYMFFFNTSLVNCCE